MAARSEVLRAFSVRENLRRILVRDPKDARLSPLDGIRALSILWVVLFHVGWYCWIDAPRDTYLAMLGARWMLPLWRGDFGVDVFFVLSGFLIGKLLFDELARAGRVHVARFYVRRLLRLWPALLVATLLELACFPDRTGHPFWPNVLYVSNLFSIVDVRMGWTWSLAIEEQFYLLAPWLLLALHRAEARLGAGGRATVLGLLGVGLALVALAAILVVRADLRAHDAEIVMSRFFVQWMRGYDVLYTKPWMRAGPLLCGLAAARLHRTEGFLDRLSRSGAAGTAGLALSVLAALAATHWPLAHEAPRALEVLYLATFRSVFGVAVAYFLLFVLSAHPIGAALGRALSAPSLYPIAQLAYTAYLVNPIIAHLSQEALAPLLTGAGPTVAILALIDLPLTFAAALVLSVLVERPFMELRSSWAPARPG